MRRDLRNKVVLITGASRGIGRRVALLLAKAGARVVVTARTSDELDTLVQEIEASGGIAASVPVDLTDAIQRDLLVKTTVETYGGLDVLVNCAGVASFGEFASSSPDILRRVMEINFFVPTELMRLCHPYLVASRATHGANWRPAILNVASICGRCGIPSLPEHCASKHALVGLSEVVRMEYAKDEIDVLVVLPGVVKSDDINRHMIRNEGQIYLNLDGAQSPEDASEGAVRCLIRNRRETAVGFVSYMVWLSRRFWPRLLRWIMKRKVQKFAARSNG